MSIISPHYAQLPFFWWYTSEPGSALTLRACSLVTFAAAPNNGTTQQPTPPYTLIVVPSTGVPQAIPAGDGTQAKWRVNYPIGTQLLLTFVDSNGLPGGTSALTTVIGGATQQCLESFDDPSTLSLGYTPAQPYTCQQVSMLPSGGTPPYTVSIVKSGDQPTNISQITNTSTWTNDMQAGGAVIYALSDSAGLYAETSEVIFSAGGQNTSCFTNVEDDGNTPGQRPSSYPNSHKSTTSKSLIGGIIAASLISAALLGLIVYLLWKRRKNAAKASKRISFTNQSGIFRQKDSPASTFGFFNKSSAAGTREKPAASLTTPFPDDSSVHSLQNLHPFKFRVVNPDLDNDESRQDLPVDAEPPSPSINSHSDHTISTFMDSEPTWRSDTTAHQTAYSHGRTQSGDFKMSNRRRSSSIKNSPNLNSPERRRSGLYRGVAQDDASRQQWPSHQRTTSDASSATLDDYQRAYSGYM